MRILEIMAAMPTPLTYAEAIHRVYKARAMLANEQNSAWARQARTALMLRKGQFPYPWG